jgi:hypothetical protein
MEIAQEIADRLSDEEIEQCKQEAIAWIDEQEMKSVTKKNQQYIKEKA